MSEIEVATRKRTNLYNCFLLINMEILQANTKIEFPRIVYSHFCVRQNWKQ